MSELLVARNITRDRIVASRLEIGRGLWAKFKGLMGRPALPAGGGLWLPDSNGIHMMFMRFPIDAAFVGGPDRDGVRTVLSVHPSLRTWSGLVPFVRHAKGVLELPDGTLAMTGTVAGDRIEFETPA